MGSGGRFGIWLDDELLHGSSGYCETFGNPCLCDPAAPTVAAFGDIASAHEFECHTVEVWGVDAMAVARRQRAIDNERGAARDIRESRRIGSGIVAYTK